MIFWISIATFLASGLTFFSGFGLGTLLMPVVAIFLPVPIAVAITAIVHLMSKIFKVFLLWKHIDRHILLVFGVPALLAAIPGALLLTLLSELAPLGSYTFLGNVHAILPVKLAAGSLLMALSSFEWVRDDVMPDASFPCEPREQLGKLSGVSSSLSSRIADKKRWMPAFLV